MSLAAGFLRDMEADQKGRGQAATADKTLQAAETGQQAMAE